MNIAKVIRGYFIFMLMMVGGVFASQNLTVQSYYVNVLEAMEVYEIEKPVYILSSVNFDEGKYFTVENKNPNSVSFRINDEGTSPYAYPGDTDISLMNFVISTKDQGVELENLKLMITGIDPVLIENVRLVEGVIAPEIEEEEETPHSHEGAGPEEVDLEEEEFATEGLIATGVIADGYITFEEFNYSVDAESEKIVTLKIDLGNQAKSGYRLRIDIEKDSDIGLYMRGRKYKVGAFYPMEGEYLSIVKKSKHQQEMNDE